MLIEEVRMRQRFQVVVVVAFVLTALVLVVLSLLFLMGWGRPITIF